MRKIIALILFLLLCPTLVFADRHRAYRSGPPPSHYGPRYDYRHHHHHHDESWVPLAIVGGLLGVIALSQMAPPPPPPPQRICRDSYNYYDEHGQYLYTRYVDRPCN